MSDEGLKRLEAREIELLRRRTEVLDRQQKQLLSPEWPREEVEELSREQDEVESELAEVRERMRAILSRKPVSDDADQ